jgi:hypothetical protein
MSDGKKPFWSSLPGVATGVAGVVSAIVGLFGMSVQLGWIGDDDGNGNGNGAVTSTVPGATSTTNSTVRGATTLPPAIGLPGAFVVDPTAVTFEPLAGREATVTISNTGESPLTMRSPTITGSGAEHFEATDVNCTRGALSRAATCQIKVTFAPERSGQYTAVLVLTASNGARQVDVALRGNAPLG